MERLGLGRLHDAPCDSHVDCVMRDDLASGVLLSH
jgi:hypothetical protein